MTYNGALHHGKWIDLSFSIHLQNCIVLINDYSLCKNDFIMIIKNLVVSFMVWV